MSIDRITRVNELLRREIGEALFHIVQEPDLDMSAITVTHVVTSRNLRSARVLVSIRDHRDQRKKMISLIRNYRQEIQQQINRNLVLKYTPRLEFELDTSLEEGDHVLSILEELSHERELNEEVPPQTCPREHQERDDARQ